MSESRQHRPSTNASEEDPILESTLEDYLAGRMPPDLSARIMQVLASLPPEEVASASPQSSITPQEVLGPPVVGANSAPIEGRPETAHPASTPMVQVSDRAHRPQHHSPWQSLQQKLIPLLATVGLLLLGITIGTLAVRWASPEDRSLVNQEGNSADSSDPALNQSLSIRPDGQGGSPPGVGTLGEEADHNGESDSEGRPSLAETLPRDWSEPDRFSPEDLSPGGRDPDDFVPESERIASSDDQIIQFIDQQIAAAWGPGGVEPAPPALEEEWARRAFLRVIGRIPTVAELRAYLENDSPNRRQALVDQLLEEDRYVEEYARHWADIWTHLLLGRQGGTASDSLASRTGLQQYLRRAFQQDKPYDQLVEELLTATGSGSPGSDDYNGAVNFLLDGFTHDAALATARTSRVFLGVQVQCAQCHTHPVADLAQSNYWEMNSFFRQLHLQRRSDGSVALIDRDFSGEGRRPHWEEAEVYFEAGDGRLGVAYPVFLDGTAIGTSGRVSQVDRRQELARLVVGSDQLSRAGVNRVWSQMLGHGFTAPVDDMGSHNAASHPALLDRLAAEFVAHDFQWKPLIRWIALSESFGLSSRITELNQTDMPQLGRAPLFTRYYSRQMRAEEVYDSLMIASRAASDPYAISGDEAGRGDWLGQLASRYQTEEGEPEEGTLPQALMHGALMRQATSLEEGSLLHGLLESEITWQAKVEHLFLAAVARTPSRREFRAAESLLTSHTGNEGAALQDIWWALLNSNEFIVDH